MRGELVSTPDRLAAVGSAWDRLWQATDQLPFQSHGWISAWFAAQDATSAVRLHVGLCWDDDALAAIIPCATRRHYGIRVLEYAAKDCTDYCDAIANTPARPALDIAWHAITQAGGFHVSYLSHIRPGAVICQLAAGTSTLRPSGRAEQALQVRSNGLKGAAWFRTLPKKARNNHTRGMRILNETGPVSVSRADGVADPGLLERMIALKRQWLAATGQRSRLLDDGGRMLRALVACLQGAGTCQLFTIACRGELVAGLISIVHRDAVAPFFSAFDPRFDRASPGNLVIVEQLVWAFDQGFTEVDFLCGDEPYKSRYANNRTDLAAYVGAHTWLGGAALAVGEWLARRRRTGMAAPALSGPAW